MANDISPDAASRTRRSLTGLAIARGASSTMANGLSGTAVAQSGSDKKMLLAPRKVEDFDKRIEAFEGKSFAKRTLPGSTGATVFRDPNDKARDWVMFERHEEGWQSFVSDPDVPPIMNEAGHTSKAQPAVPAGCFSA